MPIVSHQESNSTKLIENAFVNRSCSFEVMPYITLSSWLVTRAVSAKLLGWVQCQHQIGGSKIAVACQW
jgi:hypothetical protein